MVQEDDLVEYGFRRVIITITAVLLCALLEIVNVSLTDMRGSLGATLDDVASLRLMQLQCDCDSDD
jgi:DHA2 family multidrug resistance protein